MRGPWVAAIAALLAAPLVGAPLDDYRVAQWTTQQGLPQNTVNDIVFLEGGELWLATFGGLARFDGHAFRVLDMAADEGLPANRIVSLAPDGEGSFLFLSQQGHLGRVEAGRARLLLASPAAALDALELVVDRSRTAFFKAGDGSIWRSDCREAWRVVLGPSPGGSPGHDLGLDAGGDAWGLWGDRLVKLSGGQPVVRATLPEYGASLAARPEGDFWIGLRRGIARVVGEAIRPLEIRPALEDRVTAIEPDGEGAAWIATGREVARLDRQTDGSWRRRPLPLALPPALSVPALRLDREGSLWVGAAAGGLLRVNRLPTRRYGAAVGLGGIGALASDGHGGAVIASGCRGLFHLDREGDARPIRLPAPDPGLPEPPCGMSLAQGPWGSLWVRSGSRLLRLRGVELEVVADDLPPAEGPVVSTPDGPLWVASRSGRLELRSPDGEAVRTLDLAAPLMSASLGPDGALWVGGDGEVFRISADRNDRFGPEASVPRGLVRDILVEPDGTAWIGTYGGGLGRLRGGRVARITAGHGLPDNSVSRILDDRRGRLWISTNRGIAVLARRDLVAVAEGLAPVLEPVVLGAERGVPEANFGSPAGFAEASGRLWFGTIDGAVTVDAATFPFNGVPPSVRIEEVRAGDASLPLGPTVRVPPLAARLRVTYGASGLLYPERLRFRFRVEGLDEGWVDAANERTVDWSPPAPGRYRFLVEARNEDGVWSSAPAALVLDVLPAWWQTLVFRLTASAAGALLAAAAVRQGVRGIQRRHAERLRVLEQRRQTEQRLAEARAQLERVSRVALAGELAASIAHEVQQPLGAIVNNAEAGRRNLARYLERPAELEQIFRDVVADGLRASDVVRGLRGFLGAAGPEAAPVELSALVREMLPLVRRELEDNRVRVDLDLDPSLPAVEGLAVQLGQVVVNLLLNACEALERKDGDRRVLISTGARGGRVELAVEDNGAGLDPAVAGRAFEPFVTTKPGGLGVGLAICRTIAERHGGSLSAEARPEGGLRMVLSLPRPVQGGSR